MVLNGIMSRLKIDQNNKNKAVFFHSMTNAKVACLRSSETSVAEQKQARQGRHNGYAKKLPSVRTPSCIYHQGCYTEKLPYHSSLYTIT